MQFDAQQLQEGHVQLVWQAIDPVGEHVGHPREQLDQRDPRIRDVLLGPFGAAPRDAHPRLGNQFLEAPIVELDLRECHAVSSAGMR